MSFSNDVPQELGNESSLDVAMVIDNPKEIADIQDDFKDLDSVLNFQSQAYTDLESLLQKRLNAKKPQVEEKKDDKES